MPNTFLERSRSQEEAADERAYEPNEQIRVSAAEWQETADVEGVIAPHALMWTSRHKYASVDP